MITLRAALVDTSLVILAISIIAGVVWREVEWRRGVRDRLDRLERAGRMSQRAD